MIPWPLYRELAYGVLGWSPADFANATIRDLSDGMAGWARANGAEENTKVAPTDDEMEWLLKNYGA